MRKADLIISLAEHITQVLIEKGIPRDKIETLPFGVNTGVFYRPAEKDESREYDVICSRNLDRLYNIEALLEAVKIAVEKRPGLRLVLAGDGARKESLRALARQLGIENAVIWLGWMLPDELAIWLRRSKVYVNPSLSDGTSTALTEAMASGCFPIASDIEANRPWIRDGETGFLVPESRPDQLAERILLALESSNLRSKAAKLNEATVQERANWHSIMAKVEGHYFRLASCTQRPRKLRLSDAL
jgi:glycosyltransferase involved in cell wall biosynthesis